jgi:hypothetical protein
MKNNQIFKNKYNKIKINGGGEGVHKSQNRWQ